MTISCPHLYSGPSYSCSLSPLKNVVLPTSGYRHRGVPFQLFHLLPSEASLLAHLCISLALIPSLPSGSSHHIAPLKPPALKCQQ